MSEPLTAEQIKNWRYILFKQLGPYAFIMPDSQVQAFRDKFQNTVVKFEEKDKP